MPTVIFVLAQTYLDEGLFKASKSAITKKQKMLGLGKMKIAKRKAIQTSQKIIYL